LSYGRPKERELICGGGSERQIKLERNERLFQRNSFLCLAEFLKARLIPECIEHWIKPE
jgi:hypothetical protein